ncbi:MAG TPA: hypothetical protein VHD33_05470, partial [Legionellaceae bacterium]|nr:hypothetical protein [Legionellaceae bacterium]
MKSKVENNSAEPLIEIFNDIPIRVKKEWKPNQTFDLVVIPYNPQIWKRYYRLIKGHYLMSPLRYQGKFIYFMQPKENLISNILAFVNKDDDQLIFSMSLTKCQDQNLYDYLIKQYKIDQLMSPYCFKITLEKLSEYCSLDRQHVSPEVFKNLKNKNKIVLVVKECGCPLYDPMKHANGYDDRLFLYNHDRLPYYRGKIYPKPKPQKNYVAVTSLTRPCHATRSQKHLLETIYSNGVTTKENDCGDATFLPTPTFSTQLASSSMELAGSNDEIQSVMPQTSNEISQQSSDSDLSDIDYDSLPKSIRGTENDMDMTPVCMNELNRMIYAGALRGRHTLFISSTEKT